MYPALILNTVCFLTLQLESQSFLINQRFFQAVHMYSILPANLLTLDSASLHSLCLFVVVVFLTMSADWNLLSCMLSQLLAMIAQYLLTQGQLIESRTSRIYSVQGVQYINISYLVQKQRLFPLSKQTTGLSINRTQQAEQYHYNLCQCKVKVRTPLPFMKDGVEEQESEQI